MTTVRDATHQLLRELGVTAFFGNPARAEDIPAAFMRAYATALQPPAGPVFLSLPLDDWDKSCARPAVVRAVSTRIAPDPLRMKRFADVLTRARDPVLILGGAVDRGDGWAAAIALAEKLDVHVWAAPSCERAPFPEHHHLYLGGLPFAIGPLCKKLEGHDIALVLGAPVFRYYPYIPGEYLPAGLKLLHISDDPAETSRAPVGDSLLADPVLAIEALLALVATRPSGKRVARQPQAHRMAPYPPVEPARRSSNGMLTSADVFVALSEVRPDDAVLVEETPSNLPELHKWWPVTKPASFFTFASGGLGWSLPASVGVALGERATGRNRQVVVVIGDGSLQYSVQSLWSAAQQKLPIVIVVLRNGEYCILKSFAALERTPGVPGLDIPGIDAVSIARGYGCAAERVTDVAAFKALVSQGIAAKSSLLIEVPISSAVPQLI